MAWSVDAVSDRAPTTVVCTFYERVEVGVEEGVGGRYRYDMIYLSNPESNGYLETAWPPLVGDTIFLFDQREDGPRGGFRVVDRDWRHASWGSTYWPILDKHPTRGPALTIIVVRTGEDDGPFRGQVVESESEAQ